jgi:ribonuclease III
MQSTNYINDGFIMQNTEGTDEIIHIPYNINNILITEKDIINILNNSNVKIDKINHIEYFIQAFTHKSYCKKDIYPQHILDAAKKEINSNLLLELLDKSYERLEYFGDRVLKVIVSMYLFHRYPKQDEGFMTRLQTKIEDKKNLAQMSKELGLGKYFIISKQIEQLGGRQLEKMHEDIFESFIGALFLSNGFETCLYLITNLLETLIDYSEKLYCDNNYKDQLLRLHHQKKWKYPQYITIYFEGPPHKRKYIMGVEKQDIKPGESIETRCISYGIGLSKKEGEQNAAKMALIIHGFLNRDQYIQADIYYPPWNKIANNPEGILIFDDNQIELNIKE